MRRGFQELVLMQDVLTFSGPDHPPTQTLLPGQTADYLWPSQGGAHVFQLIRGTGAQLVVLFPSLRPATARFRPVYMRLSWNLGPDVSRLYAGDPRDTAGVDDPHFRGSWFQGLHGKDGFERTAEHIQAICADQKLDLRQTILYGSSMGGFAALAVGALLPGTRVLAEAPQVFLDRLGPPLLEPALAMLRASYGVERFEDIPPDLAWRLHLPEILARTRLPRGLILCRESDLHHSRLHAQALHAAVPALKGRLRLKHYDDADGLRGHTALPRDVVCARLQRMLASAADRAANALTRAAGQSVA
jgi:pimeloyl-ACP methyl ester carboxylesterase